MSQDIITLQDIKHLHLDEKAKNHLLYNQYSFQNMKKVFVFLSYPQFHKRMIFFFLEYIRDH
jgi:hypothetical protein